MGCGTSTGDCVSAVGAIVRAVCNIESTRFGELCKVVAYAMLLCGVECLIHEEREGVE